MRQQGATSVGASNLHLFWLLASEAENSRTARARRLGRNRESVSA